MILLQFGIEKFNPDIVEAIVDLSYFHQIGVVNPPETLVETAVNRDGVAYIPHKIDGFGELKIFLDEIKTKIHEAFERASGIIIRPEVFKLNSNKLLKWQKKVKGYNRLAFGFTDNEEAKKMLKQTGFIVGNEKDLLRLKKKIKGFNQAMRLN